MMLRSIAGQEPFSGRGDVCVSDIGSDDGFAIGGVFDDTYPELIGRALESQGKNRLGRWSEW